MVGTTRGKVDVLFDVAGYVSTTPATGSDGLYSLLVPARILDTRNGTGVPIGQLGAGQTLNLQTTGAGGVPPSGVSAVVLNLTVTKPTAPSYLTIFPSGASPPLASNLNFIAGQTVPNRVIVGVGTGGQVSFFNGQGSVDIIADVGGWFTDSSKPSAIGSTFVGVTPARILGADAFRIALGSQPPSAWLVLPSGFALAFAIGSILAGSLGEEIGWRGFGQARLQRRDGR